MLMEKKKRTGWTKNIPEEYFEEALLQGMIQRIEYDTVDYTNNEKLTKASNVYLPYGYKEEDSNTKYNIFYLMYGWTDMSDEFFQNSHLVNILDYMIQKIDIPPLLVVTPTFDADNQAGQDFARSVEQQNLLPSTLKML